MKVSELIELLQDRVDSGDIDEDQDIQIVHQELYPLAETIKGIHIPYDEDDDSHHDLDPICYLVADGHPSHGSPYGPREASEDCATF